MQIIQSRRQLLAGLTALGTASIVSATKPVWGEQPPSFVWPDATNTGCTGTLTQVGRTGFSNPNVTVTNTHFTDGIVVYASATNCIFRNCKITGGDYFGIEADNSVGLTVDRCTVIGTANQIYGYAILSGANSTITNCDVSIYGHGINGGPGVSVVRYNYIHDAYVGLPEWDRHVGGVSIKGGQTSLLVEDNFIYGQDTSCIFVKDDFASAANVTINHNKMMNQPSKVGPGYMVQAGASGPGGTVTNVRITNNFMEKGSFGHIDCDGTTDETYLENNWSYTLNRYLTRGE